MKYLFVAGFDFGTSYSKVVIRDQLTNVAKVVTFDCAPSGILPSCLGVSKGRISGPDRDSTSLLLPYPKLLAADAAAKGKQFHSLYQQKLSEIEAHLGTGDLQKIAGLLLCRYCLTIIDGIHEFIQTDEDWSAFDPATDPLVIQVAVPSGLLSDSDRSFEDLVQGALAAATMFRSQTPEKDEVAITTTELEGAFQAVARMTADERQALHQRCVVYPEVAAGVQTVLRSRSTPDGKYITLDIGAGTVDLNVFNRWRQGGKGNERSLDYWGCRVAPLGFARIDHKKPRKGAGEHETVVEPIPEAKLMKELETATKSLMEGAFRFQPFASMGDGPSPWAKETYCYVWGGGANHTPYSDHFLSALKSIGLDVVHANHLPRPSDDFSLPDGLDFGRLAVAFGLSFHEANLEDVRLPSQLKTFAEHHPNKWKVLIESPAISSKPSSIWGRVSDSIKPNFIPSVDLSSPARPTPIKKAPARSGPRRISPYEVTLAALLKEYSAKGNKMLIANRVRRLNHIWDLCKRPEVNNNNPLIEKAIAVVNQPLRRRYRGRVQVLSGSAKVIDAITLSVVVKLRGREEHEEMEIHSGTHLLESINEPKSPSRILEVLCAIEELKHEPERFHLLPIRRTAEPPRGRKNPPSSTRRPNQNNSPWNNPFRNL